ncbi:MAG: signal peptidase I [Acidimicrobiia bacterium]
MTNAGPTGPGGYDGDATAVLPASRIQGSGIDDGSPPKSRRRLSRFERIVVEWVLLIVAAVTIAVLIKTFLFQAFYIPSASMQPTLDVKDRVLVNKLSYEFHDVNRGDIVVFEAPACARTDDVEDFVKRVIGLPGDTVTADANGSVLINGRVLKEPYLPEGARTDFDEQTPSEPSCVNDAGTKPCGEPAGAEAGCVVPAGTVLVLGDNRLSSRDGRVFGPIDQDLIIGRVFVRIWPIGDIGFL